jgi:hypothetical protein
MNAGISGMNAGNLGMNAGISGTNAGVSGMNAGNLGINAGISGMKEGISGMNAGISGTNAGILVMNAGISVMNAVLPKVKTPYWEFEWQFGGKTVLAGLRLKRQLMVVSKITSLKFVLIFQVIFILARPSGRPGSRAVSLGSWRAWRDGANFDVDGSFQQILGMESEILWESVNYAYFIPSSSAHNSDAYLYIAISI